MPKVPEYECIRQNNPDFFKKLGDKFERSLNSLTNIGKNDPVKHCRLYKDEGCSHVDGMLCDFPKCDMNDKYCKEHGIESPKPPQP